MATKIPKIKMNATEAIERQQERVSKEAEDRFAKAAEITKVQPTALSPVQTDESSPAFSSEANADATVPGGVSQQTPVASVIQHFHESLCVPGAILKVPLHLIDVNPVSPRRIYKSEDVDSLGASLVSRGQDVAAAGFLKNGRIQLIDGGTRFRAAKSTDVSHLDVKIEQAPADIIALYNRAADLNDDRNQTSLVDYALSIKDLMDRGAAKTQKELAEKIKPPRESSDKMSEKTVACYMRIARMPSQLLHAMNQHPSTSSYTALYEVSGLFDEEMDEESRAKALNDALEITDLIKRRDLKKQQIIDLVQSRKVGRKTRERSVQHPLAIDNCKGHFKLFANKGKLDFTIQGVPSDRLDKLREQIEQVTKDFLAKD